MRGAGNSDKTRKYLAGGGLLLTAMLWLGSCRSGTGSATGGLQASGPAAPQPARSLPLLDSARGRGPAPPVLGEAPPLSVTNFGPRGRAQGGGTIYVRFNQPVVSLEQTVEDQAGPKLDFEPPVKGRTYFQTPELLVFEPAEELLPAHSYTVRLSGPVVSSSGARFDAPLSWQLETPRPRILGWEVLDLEDEEAPRSAPVFLTVDQPTSPAELQQHLRATARAVSGPPAPVRPVAVQVGRPTAAEFKRANLYQDDVDRVFIARPQGLWPGGSEISLEVTPGLRSLRGPLPTDRSFSHKFRTIAPLRVVASHCPPSAPCGLEPIWVRFNNRIPLKQAQRITITPRPVDFDHDLLDRWSDDGREVTLTGIFIPGTTYQIVLPADLTDKFGQKLGKTTTVTAVITRRPTMELSEERGILRQSARQTVGVALRHAKSLTVRGAVLDDRAAATFLTLPAESSEEHPEPTLLTQPWPASPVAEFTRTFELPAQGPSEWSEVELDLAALSGQARRAVLIEAKVTALSASAAREPLPRPVRGIYRLTDLGAVALSSRPRSAVAVLRLSSGEPVAGARVSLQSAQKPPILLGSTDPSGLLLLEGPGVLDEDAKPEPGTVLVVEHEPTADHSYVLWQERSRMRSSEPKKDEPQTELRPGERVIVHMVTERDAYLPGETVRAVGWSAVDSPYQRSGLRRPRAGTPVRMELSDSRGRSVASLEVKLTPEGKFWAELPLPERGALGSYRVQATLLGTSTARSVKVEDFRVPEFMVAATATPVDVLPLQATEIRASASYFFGGPIHVKRASYQQRCVHTRYTPPNVPSDWKVGSARDSYNGEGVGPVDLLAGQSGSESRSGSVRFRVSVPSGLSEVTSHCEVSVALTDSAFQSIGAQTTYLAHASRYYLAVQTPQQTLTRGETGRVPVRALGIDGTRVPAAGVTLAVIWRHDEPIYRTEKGVKVYERTETKRERIKTCTLNLPESGPDAVCEFPVPHSGDYELVARGAAATADTRHALTEASFWVQAEKPAVPPYRRAVTLELELSAREVQPGDTLHAKVRGPWTQATGILVMSREGMREQRLFKLVDSKQGGEKLGEGIAEFDLPVDDTWFPSVHFQTIVVYGGKDQLPRIAHAGGSVSMQQKHRRLQVQLEAPAQSGPGDELPITVRVRDALGQPSAARVALWAVDEAVLSLTDYRVPDPLPHFVPESSSGFYERQDYASLIRPFSRSGSDPWFWPKGTYGSAAAGLHGSGRGGGGAAMRSATAHTTRSRFETTPIFLGDLAVGADGVAQIRGRLPDNMTTFRVTAVASARLVDGDSPGRFGMGEARVRVSAPLIVRAALPRLMRPGDAAEAGALLNNLGGPRGRAVVTVRLVQAQGAAAPLQLVMPASVERLVEPGDQLRLPFQLVALRDGKAEVEVTASLTPAEPGGKVLTDSVRLPLPVELEPTLRERVASYGDLASDEAVLLPMRIPSDARREHGGLTIATSTSLLGGVAGAAQELIAYPYGCVEQTASRLLPLAALRAVMQTYPLAVPEGDIPAFLASGVQRLLSMQTASGGFSYWPGGHEPNVYASAYATWVLHLLSRAGYPVPKAELARAADFLQRIVEPRPVVAPAKDPDKESSGDSDEADGGGAAPGELLGHDLLDNARRALAVQTLAEMGRPVPQAIEGLMKDRDDLPMFGRALLVLALHAQRPDDPRIGVVLDDLLANIGELPGTAHVTERLRFNLDSVFHSDTRTDAMLLLALLRTRPDHPLVVKLARGLLERRGDGAWRNTQETAYAVLALAEFARHYERDVPAMTARAWLPRLAPGPVWEAHYSGRSLAANQTLLPMAKLLPLVRPDSPASAPPASEGLILQRQGQGRMYYRVGLEWTPSGSDLPARAQGLRIERTLRTRSGAVSAAAPLPPAEPVALDLVIENRVLLHYVVLDIPLPAGLEALQQNLGRGQRAAMLPGPRGAFVSHEEARRDRIVVFADVLQPGTHRHTVHLRATTPGRYLLPPAQAEAMYAPEIYGRSKSSAVTVSGELAASP